MDLEIPSEETPSIEITPDDPPEVTNSETNRRLSAGCEESEADQTIHAFNISNITVIEKPASENSNSKFPSCEGSDSGIEGLEITEKCTLKRTLSTNSSNSQEFRILTPTHSCDSSIISCCSNYEEAYNLLARRNSTLLEDYKLRGDATSEGGSESSSIAGSNSSRNSRGAGARKKISISDPKNKNITPRSRTKPPVAPKSSSTTPKTHADRFQDKLPNSRQASSRLSRTKATPENLNLINKKDAKKTTRGNSSSRTTPQITPTDDGRWPSVHSKPAPLMTRSLRGILPADKLPRINSVNDTKTLEKYATLPRRRREKSADSIKRTQQKPTSRDNSATRTSLFKNKYSKEAVPPAKALSPYPKKRQSGKTKIYHEISSQTALTIADIEKAFSGHSVSPASPLDIDKSDKDVQVDMRQLDIEKLEIELKIIKGEHTMLLKDHEEHKEKLKDTEQKLLDEKSEKDGLKEELRQNTERVLAILGGDNSIDCEDGNTSCDSLLVLENRFENASQIIIKQEEEISSLNSLCRLLKRDLDRSLVAQKALLQQQQEMEGENAEIQDFMKAEMNALTDALREAETEIKNCKLSISQKDTEIDSKQEELKQYSSLRQENYILKGRIGVLEAKSRDLLVHQGSAVSGAAVALSALISRLEGLVEELVTSYNISEQELEDVIFHNEMYSNSSSSPELTPQKLKKCLKDKTPSPKSGSSFVSAVINAIKSATTTPKGTDNIADRSSSEMLDSETEPYLMMDPVLENVAIPDGYTHNMISSNHSMLNSRLSHSQSDGLNNLSHSYYTRQCSDQSSISLNNSFHSDGTSSSDISLVDQVIEVDNLVTRLLKVIRFIQMENEDCMTEVEEERDGLKQQIDKQREANKTVVKQLKDWEVLGAKLKTEVKELLHQLSNKNNEIDGFKMELNQQRKEVEKLNQDVCELSTALSKTELECRMKDDEAVLVLKNWEEDGVVPAVEVVGRLAVLQKEVPVLKERLIEKEKQLNEATQECAASRQVMSESLKEALGEAKKLYEAIDKALETLHSIQSVVQQCPPLAKLQRDLEETSFQTASALPIVPPDMNANAALIQAVANLEIASPINTTA